MEKNNKNLLSEEHLRKIKYRTHYIISESARYTPLVEKDEVFDEFPPTNPQAGAPAPPQGGGAPAPADPLAQGAGAPPTPPPTDAAPKDSTPALPAPETGIQVPPEGMNPAGTGDANINDPNGMNNPAPMGATNPEAEVDTLQNDIIKHNIEAMKSIHDQLESLNSVVQGLNSKLTDLNADVEEVREPTNAEKLMSKKDVSYPYYFNLNDFWKDNWFNQKRSEEKEKGIRELPDGTFIADFDDLPSQSKIDVQNSFNDIYESKKKRSLKEEVEPQPNIDANEQSLIDGRSKQSAIRLIYNKITPLTNGFFRDEAWENLWKVFKAFDEMNLNWYITKTEYDREVPPKYKIYYFQIDFNGNEGRPKKIMGTLTASGAGSVEYPLEKYDISVVLS